MAYPYQGRDNRLITGRIHPRARKKRKYELGREPTFTRVGERKIKKIRVRGGNIKIRLKRDMYVNVYDPTQGKTVKAKIVRFLDNPSNRNFARMGILTKGAIVETELGKVKITSRPGQDGVLNGVLIQ
ncbi:NEQ469 [Nanoarchaeum equitans Kin4-M]|uniref:Small ribosomal subunit protein eS8 n=1 Tax=Nanoarchaeum equitans (strain Kin4-M) TaxID=228908 RepID=RS8E_NANEQ|nr:RecName: Full=Small ribosomal subunit protein eS8; AltName: Full=30S ribosomal protein S8e [Nanoarchaeum equitans Kin4-M]AAR39312.1 NEQ469 [Nanoarchaeum equitans Kin4-M]